MRQKPFQTRGHPRTHACEPIKTGQAFDPMLIRSVALLSAALPLFAQEPTRPVDRQARSFGPPTEPGYRGDFEVGAGYAPNSGHRQGSTELGDVNTLQSRVRYTGTFISGGDVNWSMGVEWERFGFGFENSSIIPSTLGSVSLPLGVTWRINERWSFLGEVSPGIYSDFEDIGGSDFNSPLIAGVSYAVNDNLLVFLQVSVDPRRDVPIVGGPGVRWQINQQWALSLLLPRPRIEFRPADQWLLYAGGELVGGAYQLGKEHGSNRGDARFDDVNMTYREIRAGLGAVWTLGNGLRLEAAGGWMFDRRWVVNDRDLIWNGEGAPYVRLQANFRY